MGTAATFAVSANKESNMIWNTIIGMTSDGFPDNLRVIAKDFIETARKMKVLTKVKKYDQAVTIKVMEEVCRNDKWLFTDNIRNSQWCSYRAILNLAKGTVTVEDLANETETEYPIDNL